jgi:hypothetical protein
MNAASLPPKRTLRTGVIVRICICAAIIVCGLALRGFGFDLGLPSFIVKYGGSALWGTMVFFLVAIIAADLPPLHIALISASIAIGVELFRLVHAPWLDAFRLTAAGALLLGRIFSLWNMLAYGLGIVLAMWLDRFGMAVFTRAQNAPHSAS